MLNKNPATGEVLFQQSGIVVSQTTSELGTQRHLWFEQASAGDVPSALSLQGSLNMNRLHLPPLAYIRQMLRGASNPLASSKTNAPHAWVLGVGSAAAAHGLLGMAPHAVLTLVDIDAQVLSLAQRYFACPSEHPQWRYYHADIAAWLVTVAHTLGSPHCVVLDAYSPHTLGPAVGLNGEYACLAQCLHPQGCLAVNLHEQHGFAQHLEALASSFNERVQVHFVKGQGNPIAYAYGFDAWQRIAGA